MESNQRMNLYRIFLISLQIWSTIVFTTADYVSKVEPWKGSLHGGTMITLTGNGFAKNQFNFGDGNTHLGNHVTLFSKLRTFTCSIHKDGCHEKQITCYTPPMPEDTYRVSVMVDGVKIPDSNVCSGIQDQCIFRPEEWHTPELKSITPTSGKTGDMVEFYGRLITNLFDPTSVVSSNNRVNRIKRVYLGSHNCELKNPEEDTLFGIELENNGRSFDGKMKCKQMSKYVGYMNASFIIDNEFGRSRQSPKSLLPSANGKLYMYQSFATITSLSPATGSTEGGTKVTISGTNFDDTDAEPKVMIGGSECKVDKDVPLTISELVCITEEEPATKTSYQGNRGLKLEIWTDSTVALDDFDTLSTSDANYAASVIDTTYFQDERDNFNARVSGYFVCPETSDYRFYLIGDDEVKLFVSSDDLPENKAEKATSSYSNTDYFNDVALESDIVNLVKGNRYYIEVLMKEAGSKAYFKMAARAYKSKFKGSMTQNAWDEIQEIQIKSTVVMEKQNVQCTIPSPQTARDEVQKVQATGNVDTYFRLGMFEVYTGPLSIYSTADDVASALEQLPIFDSDLEEVTVTSTEITGGSEFQITFKTKYGDLPNLVYKTVNPELTDVTLAVTETTKGRSPLTHFSLKMNGVPTASIPVNASEDEVKNAILELFGIRCPAIFIDPPNNKYKEDYEGDVKDKFGESVSDETPYCGRFSVLNPEYIYKNDDKAIDLSRFKVICFAYRGEVKHLNMKYTYKENGDDDDTKTAYKNFYTPERPEGTSEDTWLYTCTNMYDLVKAHRPDMVDYRLEHVKIYGNNTDFYVDSVSIVSDDTTTDMAGLNDRRMKQVKPNEAFVRDVMVDKNGDGNYNISIDPHNCGFNFPLFEVEFAQTTGASNYRVSTNNNHLDVVITRLEEATRPVESSFKISFKGETTQDIPAFAGASEVQSQLQALSTTGDINVVRSGDCANHNYVVTWLSLGGDQPKATLESGSLTGKDLQASLTVNQDGSLLYYPIQGDMLRTIHDKPQLTLDINNIPSRCDGDCTYEWSASATATVTGATVSGARRRKRSTLSGSRYLGTVIAISGTGFDGTMSNNVVTIGGLQCDLDSASTTQITCSVPNGPAGPASVDVYVNGLGIAISAVQFQFESAILSISPSTGGSAGGTRLEVTGYGFRADAVVKVGPSVCVRIGHTVIDDSTEKIICDTPAAASDATTNVPVTIEQGGATIQSSTDFTYDLSITPDITDVTPSTSPVTGNVTFTVTGVKFGATQTGDSALTLCGAEAEIVSWSDTEIVAKFPPNDPGSCEVRLQVNGVGKADTSAVSDVAYILKVTNMYPRKGSLYGGTKVSIIGEGFIEDKSEVLIGAHVCEIDTITDTKIECTIMDTTSTHEVVNSGSHPVFGKGYAWNPQTLTVNEGDSVKVIWRNPPEVESVAYRFIEVANASTDEPKPGGLSSGDTKTVNGEFTFYCPDPRVIYFSSDVIEGTDVSLRGNVHVQARASHSGILSVKVDGKSAFIEKTGTVPVNSDACVVSTAITGCSEPDPTEDPTEFEFFFGKCYSPRVTDIDQEQVTSGDDVNVNGVGLGSTQCQNEVKIGSAVGTVTATSSGQMTFRVEGEPPLGRLGYLSLAVTNLGYAVGTKSLTLDLLPLITSMDPTSGSEGGGQEVTFTGTGFGDDVTVNMEGFVCVVKHVEYTKIICVTSGKTAGSKTVAVTMPVNGQNLAATWDTDDSFTYSATDTPTVTSVSPTTISGISSKVTLIGTKFGTDASAVQVKVSDVDCVIDPATFSDSTFDCNIGLVPVGTHAVVVNVAGIGNASPTQNLVSGATIDAINPASGSIHGYLKLTITGSGFVDGDTTVAIDGNACEVTAVTLSTVECITPAHAAGDAQVVVTSNGETYPIETFTYSESDTPTLGALSTTSGIEGDVITVTGTGFGATFTDTFFVVDDDTEVVANSGDQTSVTFTLANKKTGQYPAWIRVVGKGASATDTTTFTYSIGVTGINPATGGVGGWQKVTLSGQGFNHSITTVQICGKECRPVDTDQHTTALYICLTPVPDLETNQNCDVVVTANGETDTLTNGYTYDPSLTPTVTSVSPSRGGTGGGTVVTVGGSGFGTDKEKVTVTIGGTDCPVSTVTDTEIVCTTESSTSQRTNVNVEVDGNGIAKPDAETSDDFWYIDVWSSSFTWGGKSPPAAGEFVVVPQGQILLLDTDTPVLKMLLIQGGQLIFDEADVELKSENILIVDGGLLQVGTEDKPFESKATITMYGQLRSPELPIYGAKALAVRNGTLDLHGIERPITWTTLEDTAAVGATSIKIQESVNWVIGDRVVIATTGKRHSQRETETRILTQITDGGKTLHFTEPLQYEHIAVTLSTDIEGETVTMETRAEVGLLSHNILFRGSDSEEWHDEIEACPDGFDTGEFSTQTCFQGRFGDEMGSDEFGATLMLHAPERDTNIAVGRISNVEFNYVGQAFRLGRYPVHFHLNGNMNQSYIRNSALHKTFNRAINIHGSHNIKVLKNVVYDAMGGTLFLEDGIETGNSIIGNLGVFIRASTSLLNEDITPAFIWVTNPDNIVKDNSVAGGTHFGFWFRLLVHPNGPSTTTDVFTRKIPLGEFSGNKAHSMGWFALWIFEEYNPDEVAVFESLEAWNNHKGAECVKCGNVQFKNFKMAANEEVGIEFKMVTSVTLYDEASGPGIFGGFVLGYHPSLTGGDESTYAISLPFGNGFIIADVKVAYFDKDGRAVFKLSEMQGTCSHFCGGFEYHVKGLKTFQVTKKLKFTHKNEFILRDLDGSVIDGTPGKSIVPTTGVLDPSKCVAAAAEFNVGEPASVCSPDVSFHRFSLNEASPETLNGKDFRATNSHGSTDSPFRDKSTTHKNGWLVILVDGYTYKVTFVNAEHLTNFSYDGTVHRFDKANSHVILCQNASKPDEFTIGGEIFQKVENELDPSADYNGYWSYDGPNSELCYLVSERLKPSARKKRAALSYDEDRNLQVRSRQCYFKNCKKPEKLSTLLQRPDDFDLWSDTDTWADRGYQKPQENDDVEIPADQWIVLDELPPTLKRLTIYGGFEFENGADKRFDLSAEVILVYGRFVIGWPDDPYMGIATIYLIGSHGSTEYEVVDGPSIGTKAIGVWGRFDAHGKDVGVTWKDLGSSALAGTNKITLEEAVTWPVGSTVRISSTSYSAWEAETLSITALSGDGKTLTLNDTLKYSHLVIADDFGDGRTYSFSAKVAIVNRNIRIKGAEYSDMFKQSFGARVLVTSATGPNEEYFTGSAQLSNVEFYRTGQEGYTSPFDPRFSLAFINVPNKPDNPSFVTDCSFSGGFSPAIGVFGTDDLLLQNNVIDHTVGSGIITDSENSTLLRNLISTIIHTGSYQDRQEPKNIRWEAGIDARDGTSLDIQDNVVSGSERAGIRYKGQECSSSCPGHVNEVHSSMVGVPTFDSEDSLISDTCVKFCDLKLWRNFDYGIYYNFKSSVEVENIVSVENGIGFFPMVVGPSAVGHASAEKYVKVRDSIFVGETSEFDCSTIKRDDGDDNYSQSSQARSFAQKTTIGRVGVVLPSFTGGGNMAPLKPWISVMAYNSIKGLMTLTDNLFADFSTKCDSAKGVAISTNKNNDDLQHPVVISNTNLVRVDAANKVFIFRPNVGKINPSDCVDMDCDALKKIFIKDLDGSFLGTGKGSIISQSEWEWDGDPRRGLGDYRIPKTLLTAEDNSRLEVSEVAQHKGIVRNAGCTFNNDWQGYECHDMNYVMLVIESMDEDTEERRLSPVAVLCNGYLDLLNGPQDHGWCAGYTCQKRLSLFHALIDADYTTQIVMTSTTPQTTRLMTLNTDKTVIVALFYSKRYRLDVYADDVFILPVNGEYDANNNFVYKDMSDEDCKPKKDTSVHGSNCFVQSEGYMYVVIEGSKSVEIRTTNQIVVGFKFMSEAQFFGPEIVNNLATFLGVDASKIRVVKIIRESPTGSRKKRDALWVTDVTVECGDLPGSGISDHMTQAELEAAAEQLTNGALLGNLPVGPGGIQPTTVTLIEPLPPVNSEAWAYIEPDSAPVTLSKAGKMTFYEPAVPGREGQEFPVPIRLRVYDDDGAPIENLGTLASPWKVEATLIKGSGSHSSAVLGGTTLLNFTKGWANFTDLHISHVGEDYTIEFKVVHPPTANFTEVSPDIVILKRDLKSYVAERTPVVLEDTPVSFSLGLKDKNTDQAVSNIAWRGHNWTVTVSMIDGDLLGTRTANFDAGTGLATFPDLQFEEVGRYYLSFTVTSTPADYSFIQLAYVDVSNAALEGAAKEKTSSCQFKFDTTYDPVQSPLDVARFATKWAVKHKDTPVKVIDSTAAPGSVVATIVIEGSTADVNNVLGKMCDEVQEGEVYIFGSKYVALEPYMKLDGKDAYGVTCGPVGKKGLHPGVIAAIVIAVLVVVVLVILIIVWRCVIVPKNKTYDSQRDLRFISKNGKYNIEDYLFRDKTFNNIKGHMPIPAPPMDTAGTTFSLNVESRLDLYDDRPASVASLPKKMPMPTE